MRTSIFGRQVLTIFSLAMLSTAFLASLGDPEAMASEELRACLSREAGDFFTKLAHAIASSAVDPAKIEDAFIAQGTEIMVEACQRTTGQSAPADIAAFQAHMARWSGHLDRKLTDISRAGSSD
jgi:hypothetical protein